METIRILGFLYFAVLAIVFLLDSASIIWDHFRKNEHKSFLAEFLSDGDPWWRALIRIGLFLAGLSYLNVI